MRTRRFILAAGLVALVATALLFVGRTRSDARAGQETPQARLMRDARRQGARPVPVTIDKVGSPSTGTTVLRGTWGRGAGQFGHVREKEGNAEGPMSLTIGPNGELLVLDQVNARVQRFGRDGRFVGETAIGPDTAQDLVPLPNGGLAVVDRLGNSEVLFYDASGKPTGTVPLVGGGIEEGGGVTGLFSDDSGVHVEREHEEVFRIASLDGTPDPDRPSNPGRPTRDGRFFLAAHIADAASGRAIVRAFDHNGNVAWQRQLMFPRSILHLVLLDSDRAGHVFVGATLAREDQVTYDLTDVATVVVRLGADDGTGLGNLTLPASSEPEEVFREISVRDDGVLLQMLVVNGGIEVREHRFP